MYTEMQAIILGTTAWRSQQRILVYPDSNNSGSWPLTSSRVCQVSKVFSVYSGLTHLHIPKNVASYEQSGLKLSCSLLQTESQWVRPQEAEEKGSEET